MSTVPQRLARMPPVRSGDLAGIAEPVRAMKRLWDPEKLPGLPERRDREARLIAKADRDYAEGELVRV